MSTTPHSFRFFRVGGFDQVRLDRGADLANLAQLDQKLWVALSCPVKGVEFDARTLALIDSDADGHVRAPELIAAIDWAIAHLKSADTLVKGGALALADIGDPVLEAAARNVLSSLGKGSATSISVEDCADIVKIFAGMAANGDGVVDGAGQAADVQAAIALMIDKLGGVADRGGAKGVDRATVERFFAEAAALQAWRQAAPHDADGLPDLAGAHDAVKAVRDKVDDYFMRVRLSAFDPRAEGLLNASEDHFKALSAKLLAGGGADVAALPLALVRAGAALPLKQGVNPAWADAIEAMRVKLVQPLLGERESLTEAEWADLRGRIGAHEAWLGAKPATPLDAVDEAALAGMLAGDLQARLMDLVAQDEAAAEQAARISEVERLVHYVRDLARLANNFVSFTDFYTRRDKASFQAGTLYMDGRSADLCVKVLDAGKHAALATMSGVYLAYCDCTRPGEKMTVAAAFTAGDSDQLMVGRNGIFYDRQGRDWDATITKIVEHPISIQQAFWSPYKRVVRLIGEQVQKFAAAKAKASEDMTGTAVAKAGDKAHALTPAAAAAPAKEAPPAPFDVAKFAGIFAAVGLAVGAIGTALASVLTGFMGLKVWQMPLALIGLMLIISGPAVALAFFKLRNRNLGPILDANGWAVNTRARINIPFGTALTQLAALPAGAERALVDPYAEKSSPWPKVILALAVVAGAVGYALWSGLIKF
ncbi:MAG: hypothetical protein RI907_3214 [Pseudomonadota bacterium]|jgi:hypothetical protein